MRNDFIDAKPMDFDFGEGYTERWNTVEPFEEMSAQELAAFIQEHTGEDVETVDEDGDERTDELRDEARECVEGDDFAPMMNYAYPIGNRINPEQIQALLVDTSLVCVTIDDESWLALSGGGMDFSWEICEAYILLGYLPPAHFCELPKMAGRGASEGDQATMRHCLNSLEMLAGWKTRAAERMREYMENPDC